MAVTLITGCSSGFGLATARSFAVVVNNAGLGHLSAEEWGALIRTPAAAMRATNGPPTSG